ncbi:Myotubularin-related protein 9 [Merluccius polli]|uniref:Myotubularin-related protein 9 n=1 Tax=Merluccius polli TaxID=89951 RepID=A0AA47N7K5_MERPO|nr:Myotubularin-related protein 9 [Merluccius polli]
MEFSDLIRTANVQDVVLRQPFHPSARGTLCITGHHLLFSDQDSRSSQQVLLLLLRNIDAIEKRTPGPSSGTLTIKCKDLCVLQLDIPGMEQCLNIAHSIEALSSLDEVADMYPFFHRPSNASLQDRWGLFSPQHHYDRMEALQRDRWRVSDVNRDFTVCPSYPPSALVPKTVNDKMLLKAAKFRQAGRFPVLCYYHRKNGQVLVIRVEYRGVLGHTSVISEIIEDAKRNHGDLTVLWLDLINVYDTIPHTLVEMILVKTYHVPERFQKLLQCYFDKFNMRFTCGNFTTDWQRLEVSIVTG